MTTLIAALFIVAGLVFLTLSGDRLVEGAVFLGRKYKLSEVFIGIVVVGFGTSLPEMVAGAVAANAESAPLVLGNMIGSNIANIGLVLGVGLVIISGMRGTKNVAFDYMLMIVGTILFLITLLTGEGVSSREGFILILALGGLLFGSYFYMARTGATMDVDVDVEMTEPVRKAYLAVIIGIVGLYIGAELLINGAIDIARSLGVTERVIGLTIVAVGTSLPELAATWAAAKRANLGMVLGNICGSNLFNLLACIGVSALIYPLSSSGMQIDVPVLGLFSVLMALLFFAEHKIYLRVCGVILLALYFSYMGFLWMETGDSTISFLSHL